MEFAMQNFLELPADNDFEFENYTFTHLSATLPADDCFTYEQILCGSWKNYIFSLPLRDSELSGSNGGDKCVVKMSDILPNNTSMAGPLKVLNKVELTPTLSKSLSSPSSSSSSPSPSPTSRKDVICSRCGTNKTSLWRRRNGETVCNACALYEKLHGIPRPAHLLHQEMRKRNRGVTSKRSSK